MNINNVKSFGIKKYIILLVTIICIIGAFVVSTNISNADQSEEDNNQSMRIGYTVFDENSGWYNWAFDGDTVGKTNNSGKMKLLRVELIGEIPGDVEYQIYINGHGWLSSVKNSQIAGAEIATEGIGAIKVKLKGKVSRKYNVYYRVNTSESDWYDWTSNGKVAGNTKNGKSIEGLQIKLVKKGNSFSTEDDDKDTVDTDIDTEVEDTPFHKYTDLTEEQLRGLARLCQQEQGTARGAAAEASLMANHLELRHNKAKNYEINGEGLYYYVRESGWFAHAAKFMDMTDVKSDILEAVRKVLVEGKRTLPAYVNEHDCFSDIETATNDGVEINKKDKSAYVQYKTLIKNVYGGSYIFYSYPSSISDPFGYTSEAARKRLGDFCYDFDEI